MKNEALIHGPVLGYLGHQDNLGKLGPDTSNHELGYMKSNLNSLIPWFTLNKALLDWQINLRIEFDLFFGILGIMTIWGELGPKTSIMGQGIQKIIQSLQFQQNQQTFCVETNIF